MKKRVIRSSVKTDMDKNQDYEPEHLQVCTQRLDVDQSIISVAWNSL